MLEIKFRGKRKDNGELVYGFYYAECGNHYIIESRQSIDELNRNHIYEVEPETVGQYTGIKNGKEVYN